MSAIQIARCSFSDHKNELLSIREAVFVREQAVPIEMEQDERDPECVHVLAMDGTRPVGTGRIDLTGNYAGKIGRVAVLQSHRRNGIGTQLMDALIEIAVENGLKRVWFHAQESAIPFYESIGYRANGEPFLEAGIVHRHMERAV